VLSIRRHEEGSVVRGAGVETQRAEESSQNLPRRSVLRAAAVAGIGAATGLPSSLGPGRWVTFTSPRSEVAISYPSTWRITTRLSPSLVYPHESFCLLSASIPQVGEEEDLPNLARYPNDAVLCWLLHYDSIVDRGARQGFDYGDLLRRPSEFDGFLRYRAVFSGSERTFLMRLWIGGNAPKVTRSLLQQSLRSMVVR
jgi:hypothetical protein